MKNNGKVGLGRMMLPLAVLLSAVITSGVARGQDGQTYLPAYQPDSGLRKIDEYGHVGHCDLTARLDNFAIELQNDPGARGFIVSYDSLDAKIERAGRNLKVARHYLVNARGINSERIMTVNGGAKDVKDVVTELWVVPDGFAPPVAVPEDERAAGDFSGRFDSYVTDDQTFRDEPEVGYSSAGISHWDFAEKLKGQPDSIGYLVIRTPKDSLPGAWRRIARRDETILRKDYGVEAERLKSVDGGQTEGEHAQVELWILPKSAPPPASIAEKLERKLDAAFKLNVYNSYGSVDKDEEHWMLENLAELLRDNPLANACFIVREAAPSDDDTEPNASAEVQEEVGRDAAQANTANVPEENPAADGESEEKLSVKELAESWRNLLAEKYGIGAHRVVLKEGRAMPWSQERLTTWVVPENAQWPDPFARDEDEEEEGAQEGAVVGDEDATAAPVGPR